MRISIAMATYNGAKYISEQLESLARQSLAPFELVVCDDDSSDETLAIIQEFSRLSNFPVKIYRNEANLGYGENFLQAASLCCGDWIAFCDQDDIWLPHKLETCHRYMREGVTMVYHSADIVDVNLTILDGYRFQMGSDKIIGKNEFPAWKSIAGFSIIFDANIPFINDFLNRPHDTHRIKDKIAHDQWIPFLATIFGKIVFVSERLVLYRQHESNSVGASPFLIRKNILSKVLSKDDYNKISKLSFERYKFLLSLIAKKNTKSLTDDLKKASFRYEKQSLNLNLRYILYTDNSFIHRCYYIAKILLSAGYGNVKYGGLGLNALVKDVLNYLHNSLSFCNKIK